MRIFVIGTGRCGTVTFSKACKHITNYTSGHETTTHGKLGNNFEFPDNHIEIDPRLSIFVPLLREKYPDALFVHLQRERKSCIKSLAKRNSLFHFGCFRLGSLPKQCNENLDLLARLYYDSTIKMLESYMFIDDHVFENKFMHIWLQDIEQGFSRMLKITDAECDKQKAFKELQIKYNKS
jgi:hypothetical protein